jgi:hypothetical protein
MALVRSTKILAFETKSSKITGILARHYKKLIA